MIKPVEIASTDETILRLVRAVHMLVEEVEMLHEGLRRVADWQRGLEHRPDQQILLAPLLDMERDPNEAESD